MYRVLFQDSRPPDLKLSVLQVGKGDASKLLGEPGQHAFEGFFNVF